jgi:hypothetical protein
MSNQLPVGFAALEPLVSEWAIPDSTARNRKRIAHEDDPAYLRVFYETMQPQMAPALAHLNPLPLDVMPIAERRLLDLVLMFAEVAHFVELRWRRFYGPTRVAQTSALRHADNPTL